MPWLGSPVVHRRHIGDKRPVRSTTLPHGRAPPCWLNRACVAQCWLACPRLRGALAPEISEWLSRVGGGIARSRRGRLISGCPSALVPANPRQRVGASCRVALSWGGLRVPGVAPPPSAEVVRLSVPVVSRACAAQGSTIRPSPREIRSPAIESANLANLGLPWCDPRLRGSGRGVRGASSS